MLHKMKLRNLVSAEFEHINPTNIMKSNESYSANEKVILYLMGRTKRLLSFYGIENNVYSKELSDECILSLVENINSKKESKHFQPYHINYGPEYGEGALNYTFISTHKDYWKKYLPTEGDSLSYLLCCILNYKMEVEWEHHFDCYTAEHLLATYNCLWIHCNVYPPSSDDLFHLLIKNVCLITQMNCIEFLNCYPNCSDKITCNLY